METKKKTHGEILAIMRKVAGWSQSDLAKKCGLQAGAISQIEISYRNIGPKRGAKIAKAFGLSEDDFFRLLRDSGGDERLINLWMRIAKFRDENCEIVLDSIGKILELQEMSNGGLLNSGMATNLHNQINLLYELAKKMGPA